LKNIYVEIKQKIGFNVSLWISTTWRKRSYKRYKPMLGGFHLLIKNDLLFSMRTSDENCHENWTKGFHWRWTLPNGVFSFFKHIIYWTKMVSIKTYQSFKPKTWLHLFWLSWLLTCRCPFWQKWFKIFSNVTIIFFDNYNKQIF